MLLKVRAEKREEITENRGRRWKLEEAHHKYNNKGAGTILKLGDQLIELHQKLNDFKEIHHFCLKNEQGERPREPPANEPKSV